MRARAGLQSFTFLVLSLLWAMACGPSPRGIDRPDSDDRPHTTKPDGGDPDDKPDGGIDLSVAVIRACVLTPEGGIDARACTNFEAQPPLIPTIDFGEQPVDDQAVRTVRLFNLGDHSLVITNARVESDTTDLFLVGDAFSGEIEVGTFVDVAVAFAPQEVGEFAGSLLLPSNDPDHGSLELPIVASALAAGLCVTPETGLDFGAVPVGDMLTRTLEIENCGQVDYDITKLAFTEDDPTSLEYALRWVDSDGQDVPDPATPLPFPPGSRLVADVTYAPSRGHGESDEGDMAALVIATDFTSARIPVVGRGKLPGCSTTLPTARIVVRNGTTDITANPSAALQQTLTFDGSQSTSAAGGELAYAWRLVQRPQGSSASLTGSTPSTRDLLLELAGEYEIELVVQDHQGCESAPSTVVVTATPTPSLHLQLVWPEYHGDVDLHLTRRSAPAFNLYDDCFYYNCMPSRAYGPYSINWGSGGANPTLDLDASWGRGPETISIEAPLDGEYTVRVHYYCSRPNNGSGASRGATTPRVRVFFNGTSVLDETMSLTQRDLWTVGVIRVSNNGTNVSVTPSSEAPVKVSQGCTNAGD